MCNIHTNCPFLCSPDSVVSEEGYPGFEINSELIRVSFNFSIYTLICNSLIMLCYISKTYFITIYIINILMVQE
jgi:hypothetical protein